MLRILPDENMSEQSKVTNYRSDSEVVGTGNEMCIVKSLRMVGHIFVLFLHFYYQFFVLFIGIFYIDEVPFTPKTYTFHAFEKCKT